ncbi:T9SS type B sorting domain-containing protein [Flavobacteriaceae bacterium]|nr:T9SS type B sorting domain-containing protein [Flavobacteriaceae bacterium]
MLKKNYLLLFLFLLFASSAFSQISKVHYIPPITSNSGSIADQYIYLSTPSETDVDYDIQIIGGSTISGTFKNTNPIRYPIGNGNNTQLHVNSNLSASVLNNRGYIITASCPIYVSVRYNAGFQGGAFTSKGTAGLGTHFRTAMMPMGDRTSAVQQNDFLSYVSVMASEDNTILKSTFPNANVSSNILNIGGYNGVPVEVELMKGESYIFAVEPSTSNVQNNRFALFGALIQSIDENGIEDPTKPIAVTVGSSNGTFAQNNSGRDQGVDQIVPVEKVGHEYIFVRTAGNNDFENIILVADKDNTEIYLNDQSAIFETLNAGDFVIIEGDKYSAAGIGGNMYVRTQGDTHPVFAYQGVGIDGTGGGSNANQGMFFVPPLSEDAQDDINNIAQIDKIGDKNYEGSISIVYKEDATLEINTGSDDSGTYEYTAFDTSSLFPESVLGKPGYLTLSIAELIGDIQVKSDDELYVAYYNRSDYATSGGFYAGFATPPSAAIDLNLQSLGTCVEVDPTTGEYIFNGNGFEMTNPAFFDTWQWQELDGTNWIIASNSEIDDLVYKPLKPGSYRLVGSITCLGGDGDFKSGIIPVSICPNDSDNDGIIDNIDLDLDNDGILNSNESNGDIIFDFTAPNNPIISNNGTNLPITYNTTIESKVNGSADTTINSISGDSNGNIETKIPSSVVITPTVNSSNQSVVNSSASSISYSIDSFSEPLNLKLVSQPESHSIVSGEYFEIQVFPTNKNITLLDPNNQLIIDKNYDNETFEELIEINGLKQFSANLIRFKFNPEATSTPNFELLTYGVEGLKLTHFTVSNSTSGIFKANISGLDYFLNTDANHPINPDTVPDYLDIDSDGDECYDVTEAGFDDGTLIDGVLGNIVPTYDDSQIDPRGLIIDPAHDYDVLPNEDPVTTIYYFQQVGQAVEIIDEPSSTVGCIGDTVSFNVAAQHPSNVITYQWQYFDLTVGTNGDWVNVDGSDSRFTGFDSAELIITDIDTSLVGDYRVQMDTEEYKCIVNSNLGTNIGLTVNTPPAPPVVEPIQTFCLTDNPTVGDLAIAPEPANPAGLAISVYDDYDPNDATVGVLLDNADLLIDGTTYFIQVTDSEGCVGVSRSETKVLLPNPTITPNIAESCPGDEITITVSGVPQTALDFELANPTLTKVLADYTDNEGRLSSYFVDPDSKSFSQAEDLLPNYGIGASMYQINDLDEHDAVFAALQAAGLTGVPLWLGLKQFPALNPNQTFDEGWYWLDGRELDPTWNLWEGGEPNDYEFDANCNGTGPDSDNIDDGSEDYGHFNLSGNKFLNDYPNCDGSPSRPVYEFRGRTTVRWYYEDPNDPGTYIDIPVNASTLTLNPELTTTYFIDVTTNGIVCSTSYTHVVNPLPISNPSDDIYLCDEVDLTNLDSTSTDGISYSFDLESQTRTIVNGQVDRDDNPLIVTYHTTFEDAESGDNPITSPYTNVLDPVGNLYDPQTIYVRILNNATGCYDATGTFNIIVNSTPESNSVEVAEVCDDTDSGSDVDGSTKFDLTLLNNEILGTTQTATGGFKVTYHLTQEEANDPITYPNGIADPAAHYNTPESTFDSSNPTVQTEEIFVRVTDTNSSTLCFRADTSFVLTVNPLPVILNPIWKVEQCDNPLFDLTDYDEKLSTYFDSETFTYFNESGDEISLNNAENYTSSSTSVDPEIIDVVFTKNDGGCSRTAQIELKVSYSQVPSDFAQTFIAANQNDLFKSESDTDLTGQIQDGKEEFNSSIFNNIITELKLQAPLAFDIPGINFEFYGSQRDATLRNNEIDISQSTYTNEVETPDIATGNLTSNYNVIDNRWEQEIWVYIENTNLSIIQSSCIGLEHVTTLYVEKRPVIYDVLDTTGTNPNEILLLCDEQITLDRYSVFDTSTLQNLLLGNTTDPLIEPYQDISTFDVEYTYLDDDGITSITSNTLPATINLTNQEINVTLTNTVGVTAPFVSSSSVSFQVFQTPTPFSGIKLEECDDEESGADDDGISVFDINIDSFKNSLFIDPTDTSSTSVQDFNDFEFNFSLYDNNDVLLSGPTNTLDSKISAEDGYYIISEISNPLSTELGLSCESSVRTDFIVNPLPNFDIDEEIIVCLNPLPDNPLEIGTYNWNGGNDPTIYNYTWSRVDLIGNQDSDFIENTPTIKVDKGGVYTVIVEDPITFCTRSKSITVTESEIAKISLEDIIVKDLTNDNTNTIEIDTLNLGIGDYEFSLDEAFGPFQDEPIFESVKPGIHTVYIRDKNSYYTYDYGCGIAQIDVSVVGYKKYFTPNGDGINETWKILGIRSDFNSGSKVYIFDRFGKLLKELDPLSKGWDGTYLGKPMPATDYWFRTFLEDGREFKGHFSLVRGN